MEDWKIGFRLLKSYFSTFPLFHFSILPPFHSSKYIVNAQLVILKEVNAEYFQNHKYFSILK